MNDYRPGSGDLFCLLTQSSSITFAERLLHRKISYLFLLLSGLKGVQGKPGSVGGTGATGTQGNNGEKGEKGEKGEPGNGEEEGNCYY